MNKLNIGSGYKRYEGFLNVDGDINCNPDYLVNLETDKLPFEDNSVEAVKAYHILEHLGEGYFNLLKELYRVCGSGAIIDVIVPHHFHEVFLNDPTHRRPITVEGMRLFSKKFNRHDIERGGSCSSLGIMLDIDFEIIDFNFTYDSFYDEIIKNNTQEQNYRLMRECVNVAIETNIKLAVIK
jgi:hypothetical protein